MSGLIDALARWEPQHKYTLLTNSSRPISGSIGSRIHVIGASLPKPLWEQFAVPAALLQTGADIYHIPHEGGPVLGGSWHFIATIYDVIPLLSPELYIRSRAHGLYYRARLETIRRSADAVITCSEAARSDLIRLVGIDSARISLVATPVDASFRLVPRETIDATLARLGLPQQYILSVGSVEPRKNLCAVLEAYAKLIGRGSTVPPLVLYGRDWRGTSSSELVKKHGLTGRVMIVGGVAEEDLVALYSGASLFVYVSLLEGYGLPVLEAMACHCPVITSDVSSMPEVAGGAALLCNPNEPGLLAELMAQVLESPDLTRRLKDKGALRVSQLSWEHAARETCRVYEIVNSNRR